MINCIVISGNLCREPETRQAGDKRVCNLRLAVNEAKEKTSYWTVKVWGQSAEFCSRLGKGSGVVVSGRLTQEEWTGKDGQKRTEAVIVATAVEAKERRQREPEAPAGYQHYSPADDPEPIAPPPEDLPF